ncbi:MAG TPA: family 1 encapsulin nanocompartment shell protein [Solirubrobacteraceae bacterium]|nr:family 1 encapsulin nanocompartment shell protein [Solirubrobacteraceae bacterium]
MSQSHLLREHAPITDAGWKLIDDEARERLTPGLAARRLVDFAELDAAAQRIVEAENTSVFHAWPKAGIDGIAPSSPHKPIARKKSFDDYPGCVARAVELLLRNGIEGPYGVALGREDYTSVVETAEHGGYPLLEHLREIVKGPLVWAPGVKGAVVLSMRGGDYCFESGEDLSVGYESHDANVVNLYIEESYSFRVLTPEAAVAITAPRSR